MAGDKGWNILSVDAESPTEQDRTEPGRVVGADCPGSFRIACSVTTRIMIFTSLFMLRSAILKFSGLSVVGGKQALPGISRKAF